MAEVIIFCSKTKRISPTEVVGYLDVNLRHPVMFTYGYRNHRISFPMDFDVIRSRKAREELTDKGLLAIWNTGAVSHESLLRLLDQ